MRAIRPSVKHVASGLSLVGLIAAGMLTYSLIRDPLPVPIAARSEPTSPPAPTSPSASATVGSSLPAAGRSSFPTGSIAYARNGILFVQNGSFVTQITSRINDSKASDPVWSPDGKWVYYIDTRRTNGWWYNPNDYGDSLFLLTYPVLCRVHPDGSGAEDVKSSLIEKYGRKTFFWMRHPSISPDGTTVAMISDGPTDPGFADTVLSFVNLASGSFENTPELPDVTPLGHAEPAYSPDGKQVAYVEEGRNGDAGDPTVWLYDTAGRTARALARGFRQPAWSPDGRYLAVTRSGSARPDVAVIDASTGALIGQITGDGESWSPVWSPAGDALIYMNLQGSFARLRMVRVTVTATQVSSDLVTGAGDYSGLDPGSAPAWYIPDLPTAAQSPTGATP